MFSPHFPAQSLIHTSLCPALKSHPLSITETTRHAVLLQGEDILVNNLGLQKQMSLLDDSPRPVHLHQEGAVIQDIYQGARVLTPALGGTLMCLGQHCGTQS